MADHSAQSVRVMRSAGIASAAVLLSRISGLFREIVMARMFGAGLAYDAFLLGFRIPNLTRDLFAEGGLSSAFVPTFTEYLNTRSRAEAARLANLVATALILSVGLFCLLGTIFSPQLVRLLAPDFLRVPGKYELAVALTRTMFPFLLLVALAAQAMGILNACNQFGVPALSSTFFNVGSVGFGLLIGMVAGPHIGISAIEGMSWGVLFGGALQLAWQLPALYRQGFRFRPMLDWSHPGLRRVLSLMGPAILGNAAVQINIVVNTVLAAGIEDPVRGYNGPVGWLGYSFRFMQLPLGLFGVAIAAATLTSISRSVSEGKMDEFRRTLSRSLGLVFLLTIPSSVGLAILGKSMIGAIYQGGSFQLYDTEQTAAALSWFAVGLAGYSALKVLVPAFYALNDSRTPMIVSALAVIVNYALATLLVRHWHWRQEGLALTTSAVAVFGSLTLFAILRSRITGLHGRELRDSLLKVAVASVVMGVAVWMSSRFITGWLGPGRGGRLADLLISIPLGAVIYYNLCRMMRLAEMDVAVEAVGGPLKRLLPALRAKLA